MSTFRWALTGSAVLCGGFLLAVAVSWGQADTSYSRGRGLSEAGYFEEAVTVLNRAVTFWPWEPAYLRNLADAYATLAEVPGGADQDAQATLADRFGQRALELNPNNLITLKSLIHTYFRLASLDERFQTKLGNLVLRARDLCPTDPILRYYEALYRLQLGETAAAVTVLKEALVLKPDYAEPARLLEVLEKAGN